MMDNEELTINLVLERLIKVRDEGKNRVVELIRICEDNKKSQLFQSSQTNAKPVIRPLLFPCDYFFNVDSVPLDQEDLRTLEESFCQP
ncbi:unnamed protein product [Hymenolepis diminuta]|uniref:Uncharacterized protein n=1 Tax=Hymenolepis diminuta TaxID=6216 RepID=A0A564YYJ6_HYMDI|nr:unnamed protein product [Hymenolepis diminuta]